MMKWLRRLMAALAAVLVVGCVAIIVGARSKRGGTSPVDTIAPGLMHVRNLVADIYGARVGQNVILFDAGIDPNGRAIDDLLRALGARREDVSHVFISHGHFDHVAAVGLFPRARVHLGAGDVGAASGKAPREPFTPRVFGTIFGVPPVDINSPLEGKKVIDVGSGESVLALPFPGHTPGSFLFLFRGTLFTGDSVLLDGERLTSSIPKYSVDIAMNTRNVLALPQLVAGQTIERVCTGHMVCTRPGAAGAAIEALRGAQRR